MRAPDAAYRMCAGIARVHGKSFFAASWFLPAAKRRAVWAVYAFCRTADDLADGGAPPDERRAALDACERKLLRAYGGDADEPVFVALADAAARFALPLEPARDLLRGVRMDVAPHRFATFAELRAYCDLVAGTVGRLVLPILGTRDARASAYASALGCAMQMTNVLRDVGEDARMGRLYLPLEDLQRFGCDEAAVLDGALDARFAELMRFEIARVRTMYDAAEPGIALLAPESRYTVRLALRLYREILERIEENGYDVFTRRAFVPLRTKMAIALSVSRARRLT